MTRKLIYKRTIIKNKGNDTYTLKVWENKYSYYAQLFLNNEVLSSASFKESEGDMSLYRIKEYFGFNSKD